MGTYDETGYGDWKKISEEEVIKEESIDGYHRERERRPVRGITQEESREEEKPVV